MPGVKPREASDRLVIFQNQFDTLLRKFTTYTGKTAISAFGLTAATNRSLVAARGSQAQLFYSGVVFVVLFDIFFCMVFTRDPCLILKPKPTP